MVASFSSFMLTSEIFILFDSVQITNRQSSGRNSTDKNKGILKKY
jgi:hypothetical protein